MVATGMTMGLVEWIDDTCLVSDISAEMYFFIFFIFCDSPFYISSLFVLA